ncbi:MAG TPA: metal ABC transporter ATP-binding protein [Patescibacteria group bacterium]|nr:metal ABC transporter ATP-binding protein [Patescibacteria group bacterium]
MENIIEAKGLSAGYRNKVIWDNADFCIKKGEFVGVLGPNGAGKSTLIKLLLGLNSPLRGSLKLFNNLPKRGNLKIGYVPQRRIIDEQNNIEVYEFIRMGLIGTKWGFSLPNKTKVERNEIYKILEETNSKELAHRPIGQLSGGELQRIFLAQALINKPDLLLLDEPLTNLDIRREAELIRLIADIVKSHEITVLLIAHDINPLLPYTDNLIYIVNGKIVKGTTKEIINSKTLSQLYGAHIDVLKDKHGRLAVLGTEVPAHHV